MKKYLGIFELYIRTTFYNLMAIFILSGVAQLILFKKTLGLTNQNGAALGFEDHIDKSGIMFVFAAAFIAVCVILCLCGCEFSSKSSYTLRRLGMSEKRSMLCQAAYNSTVFILLLCLQILLSIILFKMYCSYYAHIDTPNFITSQTLFLSFYRNDFLNSLLALEDYLKVARNIIFALGLGFVTAAFPFLQRRRKICFEAVFLTLAVILLFKEPYTEISYIVFSIVLTVIICCICFARTIRRKEVDGDEAKA